MLETIQSAENPQPEQDTSIRCPAVSSPGTAVSEQEIALQQLQSSAIVDLLLLGMHADLHVSVLETDLLETQIANLAWDQFYSPDIYLQRTLPAIRASIGNTARQMQLLQSISDRIPNVNDKKEAIERFAMMLEIDGQSEIEAALLDQAMGIFWGN